MMARKKYTRADARGWLSGQAFRRSFSCWMAVQTCTLGRFKRGKYTGAFVVITRLRNDYMPHNDALEIRKLMKESKAHIIREWKTSTNQHIIFTLPRQKLETQS